MQNLALEHVQISPVKKPDRTSNPCWSDIQGQNATHFQQQISTDKLQPKLAHDSLDIYSLTFDLDGQYKVLNLSLIIYQYFYGTYAVFNWCIALVKSLIQQLNITVILHYKALYL